MTLATLKKDYRTKLKQDGLYTLSFPVKNERHHTFMLKNRLIDRHATQTRGHVSNDSLCLFPFHTESYIHYLDAIFAMEYWLVYAEIHNLSTIRLIGKEVKEYTNGPLWIYDDYVDLLNIFRKMGFVHHKENQTWELSVEKAINFFPTYEKIREVLASINKNDITFSYRVVNIFHKNAFLCFNYEWEGTTDNLEFLYSEGQYSFTHLGKEYPFDLTNLSEVISEALHVTTERNKLKNLLNPPTANIEKLVNSLMGYQNRKAGPRTYTAIMEGFLELGYTYKEVETEATRINEGNGVHASLLSFGERNHQITVCFFEKHYLVLLVVAHNEPLSVDIVPTEKKVIEVYQKHLITSMTRKFEEQGITVN